MKKITLQRDKNNYPTCALTADQHGIITSSSYQPICILGHRSPSEPPFMTDPGIR